MDAAADFIERWQGRGDEKSDTQSFWDELLHDVLGIENPTRYIDFEKKVRIKHVKFIDAYIPSTRTIIEQKSPGVNLDDAFEQAKNYYDNVPYKERGQYIITCDFREFRIYDMNRPTEPPEVIPLAEITPEKLAFLVVPERELTHEEKISRKAGELAQTLYDYLLNKYINKNDTAARENLNIFCVRLVFLLYAEDSKLFEKAQFHDYLKPRAKMARTALTELFRVLNIKEQNRDPYLETDLAAFPYVNGGLFDKAAPLPPLDDEALRIILEDMSEGFDWSEISPPIFGAIFESILNDETRRVEGSHYTSLENIHKVIDPLFLDALTAEADSLIAAKPARAKLLAFQKKLASLTFLDPACGSGNFLTETYLSLRKLENRIIRALASLSYKPAKNEKLIRVSISQFYGIEINDFAVAVARTALWIAEAQMWIATQKEDERQTFIEYYGDFLPLKSEARIKHANALRIDWADLIPKKKLSYIMGNPPYRGARIMAGTQKEDITSIFHGQYRPGDLDYVCCWYRKAFDFIKGTDIRAALVSTNSINQGDTVAMFWKPLTDDGLHIDFAHRTFVWNSDAAEKAHVHCMVIGFSDKQGGGVIYDGGYAFPARHINAYIIDAPDWYIFSRNLPLCDVPPMRIGNKPIDGGFYLFTQEQYEEFIRIEPRAKPFFHAWYGGQEFLYNEPRMCLYLGNCSPHQIKMMPECYKRVEAVRQYRLASKSKPTQKLADTPTRFHVETFPKGSYIVIPKTSSEKRTYIPMGFLDDSVMIADSLRVIPDATLYHFGVLESLAHMAWMRVVTGRLKSDYSYSNTLVYNCFVWADVNAEQRARIEAAAKAILDARALYPDSSLAELYDETLMPIELRRAHRENDEAVREAYGWPAGIGELEMVERLVGLYEERTKDERR
ncbi:MAG: class I SAM-dependent DNA methyltransferase [Synergistaceae bacterium]|nr:class I SAM-dependent DNA methyltransferase [Synergistaceae bacterium]